MTPPGVEHHGVSPGVRVLTCVTSSMTPPGVEHIPVLYRQVGWMR
jgi:hypothetical protein